MNYDFIRAGTFGVLLLLGTSMANAQEFANLGELLDKGAKRLDAAELKALLAGATTSGTSFGGQVDTETTFASDGKASGRTWGGHPEVNPFYRGTWNINEQGQVCVDLVMTDPRIPPAKGCSYWYSLNNNAFYVARTEERSSVIRLRKIKR